VHFMGTFIILELIIGVPLVFLGAVFVLDFVIDRVVDFWENSKDWET